MKIKVVTRNKNNTTGGVASRVYDGSTTKRTPKESKFVAKSNGKIKMVTYGPYDAHGKRTKTKVKYRV